MKKKQVSEKLNDKKTIKINIAMSILLVVVLSFISFGYALYSQTMNITGNISLGLQGKIAITDVTLVSSKNVTSDSIPDFGDNYVDFNLTFKKEEGSTEPAYQAVYSITIDNATFYDYDFNLTAFQPVITNSAGTPVDSQYLSYTAQGIAPGDKINSSDSVTFTLTLDFNPPTDDTYSIDGNLQTELEVQPHGSILGAIPANSTADLRESENKDIAAVTVNVINSYQSPRTFTFGITDISHFELVDANGNALPSYTINGGDTNDYTIYIKRIDDAGFSQEYFTTNITISYNDEPNVNCGSITIHVDEKEIVDRTPPEISNLTVTINDATSDNTSNDAVGSLTLSWTGIEAESAVKKYHILMYKGSSNTPTKYETSDNNPQYTITGLEDVAYSFKVYGENTKDIVPTSEQITSCDDSYCAKTANTSYTWHFSISLTSDSSNIDNITPTAVNRGKSVTVTITPATDTRCAQTTYYTISDDITVKMNGVTMTKGTGRGQYQFSKATSGQKQGTLNLYGVTGNITIKATAS